MALTDQPSPQPGVAPPRDYEKLARAKQQVAAIKGFYVHLAIYAVINAGLFAINFVSGGPWWVLWVIGGWGIGVIAHAVGVFARAPKAVADWEARKVKEIMDGR